MTKTYNDVEAVTKLLEEKEKDLELAAKIGKTLLERNKELQQTNEFLEEQLNIANEQVTQLRHELQQKIDLLHIFTDSEADSGGSTPSGDRYLNWGTMQKKLRVLEEENLSLKLEAGHLKSLTQGLEEKEQSLVNDCIRQLADANAQVDDLSLELAEKNEEYTMQQREVSHLLKELVDRQNSEKKLSYENDELTAQIQSAQETQLELTQELMDLQERYAEVVALLAETRDELKSMKEKLVVKFKAESSGRDSMYDSLASELEASDSSFGGLDCFSSSSKRESYGRNINRSVCKFVEESVNSKSTLTTPIADDGRDRFLADADEIFDSSGLLSKGNSTTFGLIVQPDDSNCAMHSGDPKEIMMRIENKLALPTIQQVTFSETLSSYPPPGVGVPGIPGSKDLEFAIKRLSLRRRVELECQKYRRSKWAADRPFQFSRSTGLNQLLNESDTLCTTTTATTTPIPCKSKTVLVKRVEGSTILNQWRDLATPTLVGVLEKRSGIKVKGGSPPNVAVSPSKLVAKVDSDKKTALITGRHTSIIDSYRNLERSSYGCKTITTPGTYSFVSSRVMHPSERSFYSPSSSIVDQRVSLPVATVSGGLEDTPSTFSTAYAFASAIKEHYVDLFSSRLRLSPRRTSSPATSTTNSSANLIVTANSIGGDYENAVPKLSEGNCSSESGGLCDLLVDQSSAFSSTQLPRGIINRSTIAMPSKEAD